jgi:prepilin-type N-terminal cleavage/methylation domain-containing protein
MRTRGCRRTAGFTLVELLVVMGIIALLVSMLVPAVNQAVIAARKAATGNIIMGIGDSLEKFKQDWGVYPPSDMSHENLRNAQSGWEGYKLMPLALMGPKGKGWGAPEGNTGPFGGSATLAYPPYFQMEAGAYSLGASIPDAFRSPEKPIFYYRFEPTESSGQTGLFGNYDEKDNTISSTSLSDGFASRDHFLATAMYVRMSDARARWRREGYLLISPGADRLYGWVKVNVDPPIAAKLSDFSGPQRGDLYCDDITNF